MLLTRGLLIPGPTFLPALGSAPVAVYGTRKMVLAYAGSCLRVRRASDNAEQDIGFTSDGWVDTAAAFAFAAITSCFVSKWYDQSGNINDAPQATAADQPLLDAVDTRRIIFNGQRTGTSDGGQKSKALTLPNTVSLSRQAVSAFAVVRPTVSYNNNILFQLGINPQTIVFTAGSAGVFGLRAAHSTLITTVIPPPSSFDDLIGIVYSAAAGKLYKNTDVGLAGGTAPTAGTMVGGTLGRMITTAGATDNTYAGTSDYSCFVAYAATLSDADVASLQASLRLIYPTTTIATPYRIVFDGDSITEQYYSTKNQTVTERIAQAHSNWQLFNLGISGRTLVQVNTAKATNVQPLFDGTKTRNVAVVCAGINDTGTTSSGSGRGLAIRQYCAAVQGYGFKVLVSTLTPASNAWATIFADDANRLAFNADLVANWAGFADGLIDFAARSEFSDPTNATYFLDGLHPTDVGHAIRASMTGTAISAIL